MKHLYCILTLLTLLLSANDAMAQAKDGEATVKEGSTTTVTISDAYVRTLRMSTSVSATWSAGSSAISIQSRTNTSCTIKGNTPGTARLNYHCSYFIDGFYRTMDFYYEITIESNFVYVTRVEISRSSATLNMGETLQLNATAYPTYATNRSVRWESTDSSVASVSTSGYVTAKGPGRAQIWAYAKDGSGAADYCVVDVNEPTKVASIQLSDTEKSLTVGETFNLVASVLPSDAYNKTLKWRSDNEEVATVKNGTVTAVAPGECDIKCESSDGSNVSAICHVIVNEPEQYWLSVVVPNGSFAINVTDMESVRLKITPDEGFSINSVTLDGVEQEHDNGDITLPAFSGNATLNVVFSSNSPSDVDLTDGENVAMRVSVSGHTVSIKGMPDGQQVRVYDMNGSLVTATTNDSFELTQSGIYIVRIGTVSYKLAVR